VNPHWFDDDARFYSKGPRHKKTSLAIRGDALESSGWVRVPLPQESHRTFSLQFGLYSTLKQF